MTERNGAKTYLKLNAYEFGQLIAVLPMSAYKQMDDQLRDKLRRSRAQVGRDAAAEESLADEKDVPKQVDDVVPESPVTDSPVVVLDVPADEPTLDI